MVKKNMKKNPKKDAIQSTNESFSFNNSPVFFILLFVLLAFSVFNFYQISEISKVQKSVVSSTLLLQSSSSASSSSLSNTQSSDVIPTGTPKIYGAELGIKYDDVSASNPQLADLTISKLSSYDKQLTLSGADLDRYIEIGGAISCEYCCGANSIIFSDGSAACGCAHSYAMRGLAKYLLTYHGDEFTNDEILEELGKWKVLFFPGIHEQKAQILASQGIELNYINLASNKYRGIEKGSSGGSMVGGC